MESGARFRAFACMLRGAKDAPRRCSCPEYLRRGHLTDLGQDIVRSWCSASFRHQNAGLARFNSEDTATHGPWSLSRGSNRSAAPPRGPRYTGPCRNGRWPSGFPCKGKRSVREVERAGIDYWGREAERPERKGLEVRVWKSRPRQQRRYLATASERRPDHLVFKR